MSAWVTFAPGLAAGALVIVTHVVFGREVLKRGIIFLDLAVAQAAALGVVATGFAKAASSGFAVQAAAASAAVAAGAFLTWTERRWPETQEAIIGSLFVITASGMLLLLHFLPTGSEVLSDMLAGQILWTGWHEVRVAALLYAVILGGIFVFGFQRIGRLGFYFLFALIVTASVQLVGIYLVFASLILPALAVRKRPTTIAYLIGISVGIAGYAGGFLSSVLFDVPTGPAIVCALGLISALVGMLVSNR